MTDIAITVARENWQSFLLGLGAAGGADPRGRTHSFDLFGDRPIASIGDLLYVVSHGRLRCAFMIERILPHRGHWQVVASFLRPVTLEGYIEGYPQWRRRWWDRQHERPFPDWRQPGADPMPVFAHGKSAAEQGGAST